MAWDRFALTAAPRIQHGHLYLLVSIFVLIAHLRIGIWESTLALSGMCIKGTGLVDTVHGFSYLCSCKYRSTVLDSWTWDQLRLMAVGGNQAATEYFSKNMTTGSTKDAKAKYTSRAGQQYKKLLEKRAADDAIA